MLSSTSRTLTYLSGLGYLLIGGVLFLAPDWAAGQFPWNVSSFVVMTIGGWCLGNAVFAWQSARLWDWKTVYPSLTYLWLFGIFDAAVMLAFRDRVNLASIVALGYVAAVGLNVLTAVFGLIDVLRLHPNLSGEGMPVPGYVRSLTIFFAIGLSVVAAGGLLARAGGLSTEAGIFPEPLTLFSVRAFAAFFAALCLSALLLIWTRNLTPVFSYGLAGLALMIPVLIAAFVNLDKFDFNGRPGGILYIGAWMFALVVTAWGVWRYRPALHPTESIPG
ncbi:MAG: hypothetical protein EHM33_20550 [Chloroflexi bacterium]|nr:MAG: hypothetical protein EHM33_20550 [Chloroflexota bacterium]